jgi:mannitol-1-phosphate/altronate dehydrogenase
VKKKLLIYGAGAIGRGYLPWVFTPDKYEYYFVEKNPTILGHLKKQKSYTTYMTKDGKYETLTVPVLDSFEPGKEVHLISQVDAILVAVGPRNFMSLQGRLNGTKVPVLCFENDSGLPELMRHATGNQNVVFAVPDVITSNTAPKKLLDKDPLSIVTENGVSFIDEKVKQVGGDCTYISREALREQWLAKLFIHNTPHCITAYFGSLLGCDYVHEAMQNPRAAKIIEGIMLEMEQMLLKRYKLDREFIRYYAKKELSRFSNVQLYDPISRVAREPFRKLAPNERLIGAAGLCISSGFIPENLLIGLMAAFCFENETDPDFHIKHLMNALTPEDFLSIIIRLRPNEALYAILIERWQKNIKLLDRMKKK